MKLYYSMGSCSLSPHIVLRELGIQFELLSVNLRSGQCQGEDISKTLPKGYVPALRLNDGTLLTEGAVIVQYLADLKPERKLIPAFGTMERYRCMEWLAFISTEIHKGFSPFFQPSFPDSAKETAKEALLKRIRFVDDHLKAQPHLMGEQFTVADAYLFTVLSWAAYVKLDISSFRNVTAFQERVRARPAVQEAIKAEGLK